LETIVLKAIDKDPRRRFQSAAELADELRLFLADRPLHIRRSSWRERVWRWCRRNPLIAFLTITAVGFLIAACITLLVSNIRITSEEAQKERALQTARDNERSARYRLYAAQMNLAQQAWDAGDPSRTLELLEGQRPKFDQEDLRGFEWYYFWRLCQGSRRLQLRGHDSAIFAVAFAPDGKTLASGDWNGNVKLWDAVTGREQASLPGHQRWVTKLAFTPDSKTLVSSGGDACVKVWDVATRGERASFPGPIHARSVAVSLDGRTLAAGWESGAVQLWDLATGQTRTLAETLPGPAVALGFAPNGKTLAAGTSHSNNKSLRLWDLTGEPPSAVTPQGVNGIHALAFSPDSKLVAIGGFGGLVRLLDVASGQERASRQGRGDVYSVAFAPDGKSLAIGLQDRSVVLWVPATGREQALAQRASVMAVAFAPDGKTLVSGSDDGNVLLWDVTGAREAAILQHPSELWSVLYSATDQELLSLSGGDQVRLWDARTGRQRARFDAHAPNLALAAANSSLALTPDGKLLAVAAVAPDIQLWDPLTGKEVGRLQGHTAGVWALAFAPDGKTLASGSWDRTVRLWDVDTRQVRAVLTGTPAVMSLAFSPHGTTLAIGCQFGEVYLSSATTGANRHLLHGRTGVAHMMLALAFAPDEHALATGEGDGTVKLWNVASGQLQMSFRGHTARPRGLAFFPDGKTLASASDDTTVKLWDVATGQERVTLRGHQGSVTGVAVASDGHTLVSSSRDATVRIWRAATDAEARAPATELDPDDPDGPLAKERWGDQLWANGQAAEPGYRQALARWETLAEAFPAVAEYRRHRATTRFKLEVLRGGKESHQAELAYRQLLETEPPNLAELNNLAAQLITSSDPKLRYANWAVGLAKRAVDLRPGKAMFWRTLGMAHHRAGDWPAAALALERAQELGFLDGVGQFCLAMARWRLGNRNEALRWYHKGVAWMDEHSGDPVARPFCDEAAALMKPAVPSENQSKLRQ
jgi:WD40 repeat protein